MLSHPGSNNFGGCVARFGGCRVQLPRCDPFSAISHALTESRLPPHLNSPSPGRAVR